jgi:3'-5' exoribonuclease
MAKVSELKPGDEMDMVVYITFKEHRQNNENGWIKLIGKDISGEISIMLFDFNLEARLQIIQELETNKFVHILGKVESFKGGMNVKAEDIHFVDTPQDLSLYLKTSQENISVLKTNLKKSIDSLSDASLKKAVQSLIGESGELYEKYIIWPAAKSKHHAYTHGLLEHSLEVLKFAISNLENYEVNNDILVASALLHDIGKIYEYETNDGISYDIGSAGKLVPHIPYGSMLVQSKMLEHGVDEVVSSNIVHCILSHHGSFDCGSPVLPRTKESWLIHLADHRSAVLNSEIK